MAEYVSRRKVEFELCGGNLPEKYKAFVRRVLNDRNLVPTADVAPVVHGQWICEWDANLGRTTITCSNCKDVRVVNGCYVSVDGESLWDDDDYCPNCGAKMDGGADL